MGDSVRIVIDTIGGDNGAAVCVKGAVKGLKNSRNVKIILTGHEDELEKLLSEEEYDRSRLEVVNATEEDITSRSSC